MSAAPPRRVPERPFPPYAFLPGRDPHPTRSPEGHSFAEAGEPPAAYLAAEDWARNDDYLFGVDLYNHGYLWEAHEAWEGLWHRAKHDPDQADHLQGLIQCAAAALKVRMGQPKGVASLARLGTEKLERVARAHGGHYMGLDGLEYVDAWRAYAAGEPQDAEARPRLELDEA